MPWLALAAGTALTGALCWAGLALALQSQRDELQWQAHSAATRAEARLKAHEAAAQMLRAGLAGNAALDTSSVGAAAEAWRAAMPELQALSLMPAGTAEAASMPAARARDAGHAVASNDGLRLHIWLPLYARAAVPPDAGQRRSLYRGVLRYTLAPPALLPPPLPPSPPFAAAAAPHLRLLLQDGSPPAGQPAPPATVLAARAPGGTDAVEATGVPHTPTSNEMQARAGFSHAAHTWTVEARAPARPAARALLLLGAAGALGLGLSLGLAWALHVAQRRRSAAQAVAAGMSHELNQPIAALLLSSFNAQAWLEQQRPDRAAEAITKIEQAAQRMGRIVAQWPVLAREGRVHLRSVNLADALARAMQRVPHVPATVLQAPERPVHVLAVSAELEQVVASLLAWHAHAAGPGSGSTGCEIRITGAAEAVTVEILHPGLLPTPRHGSVPLPTSEGSVPLLDPAACRKRLRHLGGTLGTQADERGLAYVLTLRPGA